MPRNDIGPTENSVQESSWYERTEEEAIYNRALRSSLNRDWADSNCRTSGTRY